MKFRYIGDREEIRVFGLVFKDEPVDVDEKQIAYQVKHKGAVKDVLIIDKLNGHPDFERVKIKPGPKSKNANFSSNT